CCSMRLNNDPDKHIKNNATILLNIYRFSGAKSENVKEWLYQFESILILNIGYDHENIVIIATMHLTGIALKFYDELKTKPIDWASFREKMENRFGASKLDKPTLMLKTLSRKQQKNEPTKKFIEEIFKLGEMAGMTEDLLVHTIIGN
ncbi:hypothetical protein COBT_003449, partial [Conglomerata obtusa]